MLIFIKSLIVWHDNIFFKISIVKHFINNFIYLSITKNKTEKLSIREALQTMWPQRNRVNVCMTVDTAAPLGGSGDFYLNTSINHLDHIREETASPYSTTVPTNVCELTNYLSS